MAIHISDLELWQDWAKRDDCFTLFVPSDIRQMLGEIVRLRTQLKAMSNVAKTRGDVLDLPEVQAVLEQ